ncbi:HdeD family acid-resistance protein [Serinibacter salmoneus]|uniref:Uncharacterized membrane protein HdeD (DUF308 family) n=1 Tax=Serinibacter salmoneus TaxID=556530 RepID=A0A2A9CYD0_9MICO|nr:DUF308 domain-containing protein [Serinibacter salmoneus]PFG18589.1 uncharacterized membrane protein HdeD (DUF308 family) [Serinibacter salmoneus]
MTTPTSFTISLSEGATKTFRTALGITGLVAFVIGLLILVWPGRTAMVATALIAVYALVLAVIYLGIGIFTKGMTTWPRIGHLLLGIVFAVAGVVALANLAAATAVVAVVVAVMIGVAWLVEGVVSLVTLGDKSSKGWTIFFAVVSIIAGLVLIITPLMSAVALWWLLAIGLMVLGVVQIVRAFSIGRAVKA